MILVFVMGLWVVNGYGCAHRPPRAQGGAAADGRSMTPRASIYLEGRRGRLWRERARHFEGRERRERRERWERGMYKARQPLAHIRTVEPGGHVGQR